MMVMAEHSRTTWANTERCEEKVECMGCVCGVKAKKNECEGHDTYLLLLQCVVCFCAQVKPHKKNECDTKKVQ